MSENPFAAGAKTARRVALVAALIGVGHLAGLAHNSVRSTPQRSAWNSVDDVLAAYAGGDDLAVERWLATPTGIDALPSIESLASRPWHPATAAFVLEAVVQQPVRAPKLLAAGRDMVMRRPSPLGADPLEDQFEVTWHHTAIAVAQTIPFFAVQQEYLDAVTTRFDAASRAGVRLATRFSLARANAAATVCCRKQTPGEVVVSVPRKARVHTLDSALALYERAAEEPALRAESLVRGARLLVQAGRFAEAREWVARVTPHSDAVVGFVQELTFGRALDALDRSSEASDAYRRALAIGPSSQRAAIGLAAALLRSARPDEAAQIAASAGTMQDDTLDRFRQFHRFDYRFVEQWLAEVRRLRR